MPPKVAVFMAVHNGAAWLADVLDSVAAQTYPNIEVIIQDNASTDTTVHIIRDKLPAKSYQLKASLENIGFWAAMEKLISRTDAPYVLCLTDVILDPYFIERAVAVLEHDQKAGALQAKVLQMDRKTIDTVGFQISRSRRITNRGHGETDQGQYDTPGEIFAVEGAAPLFRKQALEDCRMGDWLVDPAYRVGSFGYGDDLDLGWRMCMFGWRQIYAPTVIAYHDRSTTKGASHSAREYLSRTAIRRQIPLAKRRLDWSNVRFSIIKNDAMINILRDLPFIMAREVAVFAYTLLFEPRMFAEAGRFLRLLPLMLSRRRAVQTRARLSAAQFSRFIT